MVLGEVSLRLLIGSTKAWAKARYNAERVADQKLRGYAYVDTGVQRSLSSGANGGDSQVPCFLCRALIMVNTIRGAREPIALDILTVGVSISL